MQIVPFERLKALLTVESLLEPVRNAFREYSAGTANVPPVQHLEMPYCNGGALHIKSGHVPPHDFCLVKVASTFPENPKRTPALPSLDGLLAVFSTEDGRPLTIIEDHAFVTQIRTAVAGAIAAELLSSPKSRRLGIIGTGAQARLQATAICSRLSSIDELLVWGRTSARVVSYIEDLAPELATVSIRAVSSPEIVARNADILVTATYSTEPLIHGTWLPPGSLVIGLGADGVAKQELAPDCILLADRVVVDSRSQNEVLAEIGRGIREGKWTSDRMDFEIGELLLSENPSGDQASFYQRAPDERIVCKLTGIATQEIFVCKYLLDCIDLR